MTTVLDPFDDATWGRERSYFEQIDLALRGKSDMLIGNGRPAHALYLIDKFFANATTQVRLFSGCLKQEAQGIKLYASPHIHRTMEALIERGGRLSIMLEEDIDAPNGNAREHPLIEAALAIDDSDSLQLRKAAKSSVDHLKEADYHHHWTVMDDWAFRLEIDIEKYRAAACFGRPDVAKALASIFDRMFEKAKPII